MRIHHSILTLLITVGPAIAGEVHVVDPGGGGDFLTITAAYAAAAPGDVLLVNGGTWNGISVNKGVAIFAEAGTQIVWNSLVTVQGIPPWQVVVLSGMHFQDGLELRNSPGRVRVQSSWASRGDSSTSPVYVADCADVILSHCHSTGADGGTGPHGDGDYGGEGIHVRGSRVALYDTSLTGGDGGDGGPGGLWVTADGGGGGDAAKVILGAKLYAMGCTFAGGDGGAGYMDGNGGAGGDGVGVASYLGYIARISDVVLLPGQGGPHDYGGFAPPGSPTSGNVVTLNVARRSLVAPAVVRETEFPQWSITGKPGDVLSLPASLKARHVFVRTADGILAFAFPLFHGLASVGVIAGSGELQLIRPPDPLSPGDEARVLFHQIFALDAQGHRVLGGVHTEVVLAPWI